MTLHYDLELDVWTFDSPTGPRVLKEPHGAPTARQLLKLAHLGLLELRAEPGRPLTKLDACEALDAAERERAA